MSGFRAAQRAGYQQRHLVVRDGQVSSHALLDESGMLWIQHRGGLYQLRRTAAGKLILTK